MREWWEPEHLFGLRAFVLVACLLAYPFGMAISFRVSDYRVRSPGSFFPVEALRLGCEACASDLNTGLEVLVSPGRSAQQSEAVGGT